MIELIILAVLIVIIIVAVLVYFFVYKDTKSNIISGEGYSLECNDSGQCQATIYTKEGESELVNLLNKQANIIDNWLNGTISQAEKDRYLAATGKQFPVSLFNIRMAITFDAAAVKIANPPRYDGYLNLASNLAAINSIPAAKMANINAGKPEYPIKIGVFYDLKNIESTA